MRTFRFVLAALAVASLAFAGVVMADCGHCGAGKHHAGKEHGKCLGKGDCPGYDQASTTTFKATVVGMDKETCKGCGTTHVDLVVKTKDDEVKVRLGPAWYIDRQDELLKKDDVIEIFASKVKEGDKDVFVAGKIVKGDDVLMLRDKDGLPMWRGWRRGKA
ncbi:MAG: hypothetical protein OEN01_02700 [Candidatus Krumholzibacteria bacterium]|nr:hypothetical protein [Candidatus Krumholzibacteria bacterium]